jgi:predicted aspartyl protease
MENGDKKINIDNVIVDTGAAHTIILSDYLAELDVELSNTDELVKASGYGGMVYGAVRKKMIELNLGAWL